MGLTVQNLGVEAPRVLLRHWVTQPETGIELGPWHEIPPDVRRSVTATAGWALDTLR
jgi:hypothetical protein